MIRPFDEVANLVILNFWHSMRSPKIGRLAPAWFKSLGSANSYGREA
jgi:hypothetical protein